MDPTRSPPTSTHSLSSSHLFTTFFPKYPSPITSISLPQIPLTNHFLNSSAKTPTHLQNSKPFPSQAHPNLSATPPFSLSMPPFTPSFSHIPTTFFYPWPNPIHPPYPPFSSFSLTTSPRFLCFNKYFKHLKITQDSIPLLCAH